MEYTVYDFFYQMYFKYLPLVKSNTKFGLHIWIGPKPFEPKLCRVFMQPLDVAKGSGDESEAWETDRARDAPGKCFITCTEEWRLRRVLH